ncbi:nucleotide exchange factor GrpE [bacterium]|nr:nucleotide exchange factor GrpE [bacterium]
MKKQTGNHTKQAELEVQVQQLLEKVTDLDTKLRTALADYQNVRKEIEKQQELRESMLKKYVFNDLIDIFSDLFFAVEQMPEEAKKDSNIQGIVMIMAKYKDLLRNHGVTEITFKEGDDYDARFAEVLGVVQHATLDSKVAQTIQPGYRIGEVLIKPARVMIYKKQITNS